MITCSLMLASRRNGELLTPHGNTRQCGDRVTRMGALEHVDTANRMFGDAHDNR
jgi:Trk K+ transport system NAD-binding subunit